MANPLLIRYGELNGLQTQIMRFIGVWVREEKTPIPQRVIVEAMTEAGVGSYATVNALNTLMRKGYLRRAVVIAHQARYIQLRTV